VIILKKIIVGILIVVLLFTLYSCFSKKDSSIENNEECVDLEYEVMDKDEIPQKVLEKIFEKKEEQATFTFSNGEELYIIICYGAKATGGYSIKVDSLQKSNNEIVVKTVLIEPKKEEVVTRNTSFPHIVLKTKDLGLDMKFDIK